MVSNYMPSRNVVKVNVPNSYYHAYSRGINKQHIFLDEVDYRYFLSLFERYLAPINQPNQTDIVYKNFVGTVDLLVYCLMKNHFHLLLYQADMDGMSKLMRSVMISYSHYFNKRYKRSGPLFESCYKASLIDSDDYLLHISRYIHCNPDEWSDFPYSSLRAYLYDDVPQWLNKTRISGLYGSSVQYFKFLNDNQKDRDEI